MEVYQRGYNISSRIIDIYNEMTDLVYSGCVNDSFFRYNELLEKLKILISNERHIYNKLSLNDVNKYIDELGLNDDKIDMDDFHVSRYSFKLFSRKQKLEGAPLVFDDITFNSSIDGIILIDVFKKIEDTLSSVTTDSNGEELFLERLKNYTWASIYYFFMNNEFAEKVALMYDYNIKDIPYVSINEMFNKSEVDILEFNEKFINVIKIIMFKLSKFSNFDVTVDKVFLALFQVLRLEVITSIIDENGIDILFDEADEITKFSDSYVVQPMKRILIKRKEELGNK